jgi:metallophosphoesterase superfamily enzyme
MREPVLILSDLHLGHKGSLIDDVAALRPLLEGAGTLVLNGDTWQELAKDFRVDGERLWADLLQMCEQMGIDVIALPGNHDPGNFTGNGARGFAELAGGKIVITHGDCVFAEGRRGVEWPSRSTSNGWSCGRGVRRKRSMIDWRWVEKLRDC